MAALTTIAVVGAAAVSAGVAYSSYKQQKSASKRAEKAQKETSRIQQNQSKIQQSENIRQKVRQERVRRAQIMAAAGATGVGRSSGEFGSTGALSSLTASNVASSLQANRTTDTLGGLADTISAAQGDSNRAGAMGGLATTVFQSLGGVGTLASGFNAGVAQIKTNRGVNNLVDNSGLY